MKAYFDVDGMDVEIEVTVGLVETIAEMMNSRRPWEHLHKIEKFVEPKEALYYPEVLFILLTRIFPVVEREFRRAQRVAPGSSRSLRSLPLRKVFSGLKYALANKIHVAPREVDVMPLEEAVDYIVMIMDEARELEKSTSRARSRRF
jgi:hypothetical protein